MIVLSRRWFWNGHLWVTVGKTLVCMFINQVFLRVRACWVNMIALHRRWSWKAIHQISWKTSAHYHSSLSGDRAIHQWNWGGLCCAWSVFRSPKRLSFQVGDIEESSACSLFRSPRRQLGVYIIVLLKRWYWKGSSSVTLGKMFILTFIVQVSWGTGLLKGCAGLARHILFNFYFAREWWAWKEWFLLVSLLDGMVWWSWKYWFSTIFTLMGHGGLEGTNFYHFHFGRLRSSWMDWFWTIFTMERWVGIEKTDVGNIT